MPFSAFIRRSSHFTIHTKISNYDLCKFIFFSPKKFTFDNFFLLVTTHSHSLQTDDYGVFQTTLTRELTIAVETYGLSEVELVELTENANRYSFARPHERQLISDKIEEFKKKMFSHWYAEGITRHHLLRIHTMILKYVHNKLINAHKNKNELIYWNFDIISVCPIAYDIISVGKLYNFKVKNYFFYQKPQWMIFMMKRDFFFGSANLNNISIFYIIKFLIKEPFFFCSMSED